MFILLLLTDEQSYGAQNHYSFNRADFNADSIEDSPRDLMIQATTCPISTAFSSRSQTAKSTNVSLDEEQENEIIPGID